MGQVAQLKKIADRLQLKNFENLFQEHGWAFSGLFWSFCTLGRAVFKEFRGL